MTTGRGYLRWLAVAAMLALAVIAGGRGTAAPDSGPNLPVATPSAPIDTIKVASGNGAAALSWAFSRQFIGDIRGIRLLRALDATEIRFNHPPDKLIEDLGIRTSWKVGNLTNGEQYEFILAAYDSAGKEFWRTSVLAYPGSDPRGAPRAPTALYGAAGDGTAALFWERNREGDLARYEVQRKGPGNTGFRTVAHVPRFADVVEEGKRRGGERRSFRIIPSPAFRDRDVVNGSLYEYRVRAIDSGGNGSPFSATVPVKPRPSPLPTGDNIVLIVNSTAGDSNHNGVNDSEEVASYYAEKRRVPPSQIIRLPLKRDVYAIEYARDIRKPLREFLITNNLTGSVTMLVPCFGMPTWSNGLALDSRLADLFDRFTHGRKMGTPNPYFDSNRHFDGTYGTYLVTRLDGPTVEIARGLVDKALSAEQQVTASSGKVYLGGRGSRELGDISIRKTAEFARWLGLVVTLRDPGTYAKHELGPDATWYFAWYHLYRDPVKGQWPTGAVGAHLTSYSFSGIRETDPAKKSWVQGLLEKGITATFGSVVEPYQQGFTRPDIFFSHFWTGDYTFAESFFMATPTVQWAMSAVGDPLYRLRKAPVKGTAAPGPAWGESTSGRPR
jgi:uncharacterized protein (TIGR03790 family)